MWFQAMINICAYTEQVLGPLDDAWSRGSVAGDRASVGTGEGAPLSEALVRLIHGLDPVSPVKVGRL